jgi:2-isopropylmalate synthase
MSERVYLFDTTLRDGAQTSGVKFSVADKIAIAAELDALGIDYIEGGWPGANPTDDDFFQRPPRFLNSTFTAFGMTKRSGRSAGNDPGLAALFDSKAAATCIVGKTWDFHVDLALKVTNEENLELIRDSVEECRRRKGEAMFDCEHFFDGYKANPDYALACARTAYEAGARWVILCDTNGGTLPDEIEAIVTEVARHVPGDHLGIHTHNDTDNAVANSLAAIKAGARMVQGTINGLGERCGNANLCSLIPTLKFKLGYDIGMSDALVERLTHVSRVLDDRLNRQPQRQLPYVGTSAFAHKGGLHVSAVERDPRAYEHIDPARVGNERQILVSDQAGRSNILSNFRQFGIELDATDKRIQQLVDEIKQREYEGYAYDDALASFELLARRALGHVPEFFRLTSFRVIDERRWNARDDLVTLSEATCKIEVGGEQVMTVAEGNGPVNALDTALRKGLMSAYPALEGMQLVDYKVRILTPRAGTRAVTRVMIESEDTEGERWSTIGVSANIIDASFGALYDAITYRLYRQQAAARHAVA